MLLYACNNIYVNVGEIFDFLYYIVPFKFVKTRPC